MRMVLEYFGIKKSEKQLIRLLGTNKRIGTVHEDFPKLAEKYKLNYFVERHGKVEDLKKFLRQRYRIIVCYYVVSEDVAHYAVIKNIDSKNINLIDPWFGPNHYYSRTYFKKIWKGKDNDERGWFVAIKK